MLMHISEEAVKRKSEELDDQFEFLAGIKETHLLELKAYIRERVRL